MVPENVYKETEKMVIEFCWLQNAKSKRRCSNNDQPNKTEVCNVQTQTILSRQLQLSREMRIACLRAILSALLRVFNHSWPAYPFKGW